MLPVCSTQQLSPHHLLGFPKPKKEPRAWSAGSLAPPRERTNRPPKHKNMNRETGRPRQIGSEGLDRNVGVSVQVLRIVVWLLLWNVHLKQIRVSWNGTRNRARTYTNTGSYFDSARTYSEALLLATRDIKDSYHTATAMQNRSATSRKHFLATCHTKCRHWTNSSGFKQNLRHHEGYLVPVPA